MYNGEYFLAIGMKIARRSRVVALATQEARFKSHFGTQPRICSDVWTRINPAASMPTGAKPVHLLWALMFLKLYSSESVLCTLASAGEAVDEKTLRKWVWMFVPAIADITNDVVSSIFFILCQ